MSLPTQQESPPASNQQQEYESLYRGDPAPGFRARTRHISGFRIDLVAGRNIVLCFLGSASMPMGQRAFDAIRDNQSYVDNQLAAFFAVSIDQSDESNERLSLEQTQQLILDPDGAISRLYGVLPARDNAVSAGSADVRRLRPTWFVISPDFRILEVIPFRRDGSDRDELERALVRLRPPGLATGIEMQAPVLLLPDVFEQKLCKTLCDLYDLNGGEETGTMNEVDGKTVVKIDHDFKRRRDFTITDPNLMRATQARIKRRIVPAIQKAHQFTATRMERYIVACYSAEENGHFNPHRDNTTRGTAHRRFAVSINLNSEFEGGEVSFPEFNRRSYKPPPGGAVVFSCSLLHAVSKVTQGRRYAFLPFLYDDAAAELRKQNNVYLGKGVGPY